MEAAKRKTGGQAIKLKIAVVGEPKVGKWQIVKNCSDHHNPKDNYGSNQRTKINFTYLSEVT